MSSGKVHATASVILASGFLLTGNGQEAIGALVGIMVTPDWDVNQGFSGDTHIRNGFGRAVETVWDVALWPYRRIFKHGSLWSHFPILSTLIRILYVFLIIVITYLVLIFLLPGAWNFWTEMRWWWGRAVEHWRMFLGLAAADLIHWVLDISTKNSE